MIIVVDIDSVIAEEIPGDWYNYSKKKVMEGARESLMSLRGAGHFVILHSARRQEDKEVTEVWLADNGIHYDALVLGKPYGDVYIDDKALRFFDWTQTMEELKNATDQG